MTNYITPLSKEQKVQEGRYEFPYHYIPVLDNGDFSQTRNLVWGYEYLSYIHFVLNQLEQISFVSLLNVGCGDGRFLVEVSNKFPDKELAGIDFSERAINYAKCSSRSVNYVLGDITNEKMFDKQFDVITLIEVLEHIPIEQISTFLDGVYRYLKDSGFFMLTAPSKNIRVSAKYYQHFDLELLKATLYPKFEIIEYYFLNKNSLQTKIIHNFLSNRLFILNYRRLINIMYHYYTKHLLLADKQDSKRIYALGRKRGGI